jgi:predicted PP-loop superfamily ATPase
LPHVSHTNDLKLKSPAFSAPSKDNISEITNSDIVEIIEHEYEFPLQSEEELQEEIELFTQEIEEV